MRIGVLDGRAVIIDGDHGLDVAEASAGRFGPAITGILENWDEFSAWAADADATWQMADQAAAVVELEGGDVAVFGVQLDMGDLAFAAQDAASGQAYWLSRDPQLDAWTGHYIGAPARQRLTVRQERLGPSHLQPEPDHTCRAVRCQGDQVLH